MSPGHPDIVFTPLHPETLCAFMFHASRAAGASLTPVCVHGASFAQLTNGDYIFFLFPNRVGTWEWSDPPKIKRRCNRRCLAGSALCVYSYTCRKHSCSRACVPACVLRFRLFWLSTILTTTSYSSSKTKKKKACHNIPVQQQQQYVSMA